MKHNKDDRRDNVDKIQENINNTLDNFARTEEIIAETHDTKLKGTLKEKNERRKDALHGMRQEIRDESLDKKRGYKE